MTDTARHAPALRTPWTPGDYHRARIDASGAAKLAASSVAPLVAAARGTRTLTTSDDFTDFRALRRTRRDGRRKDLTRTTITDTLQLGDDILALPLYRIDHVINEPATDTLLGMDTAQYRPAHPIVSEHDHEHRKPRKYLNESGDPSIFDLHPATPRTWFTSEHPAPNLLIIEGVIKADAALTHQLLNAGISFDDLTTIHDTITENRTALTNLLNQIAPDVRCVIVSIAGVANWQSDEHGKLALPIRDRTITIGFDGDIAANRNVWTQADRLATWLRSKHPHVVQFLRLDHHTITRHITEHPDILDRIGTEPDGTPARLGLDDFLANVGDWNAAFTTATEHLPDQPAPEITDGLHDGDYYIAGTGGTETHQWVKNPVTGHMESRRILDIGGRVTALESSRVPTPEESATGKTNPDNNTNTAHSRAVIELAWLDTDGGAHTGIVSGPGAFLAEQPTSWAKNPDVRIPPEILAHPDFPPARCAWEFLKAIKVHRGAETRERTGWSVMGWVPTDTAEPAFIAGETILAKHPADAETLLAGVTDDLLPGATLFGVHDTYGRRRAAINTERETLGLEPILHLDGAALDEWKTEARANFTEVIRRFFTDTVFGDLAIPAIILGAMCRPTIPLTPHLNVFFWGPPAGGKSYCASAIMGGWRAHPGAWKSNRLPGAANDTPAAAELAVAMAPIWVADDLAPSPDRGKVERQEDEIGNLVRSVFNGAAKRRTEQGKTMRESHPPRAVLIATAENEPSTDSVRDRSVMVEVATNSTFLPDDTGRVAEFKQFFEHGDHLPRLTAALIRYWMHSGEYAASSWPQITAAAKRMYDDHVDRATHVITRQFGVNSNRATRHAEIAAELTLSYEVLVGFARWIGFSDDAREITQLTSTRRGSILHSFYGHMVNATRRQGASSPGITLLLALSDVLDAGVAHIGNADEVGNPPHPTDDRLNTQLGWRLEQQGDTQVWRARGEKIGVLAEDSSGALLVIFKTGSAFEVARKNCRSLILPGQKGATSWRDLWEQGIAVGTREHGRNVAQIRMKSPQSTDASSRPRERGVPIPVETLINPDTWIEQHQGGFIDED